MKLILARDECGGIGICNTLPWHCKEDLQHFSNTTRGSTIVMGRNTWQSLGAGLPNRKHIVITSNPVKLLEDCMVDSNIMAMTLEEFKSLGFKDCFLIGGASLVEGLFDSIEEAYITEIKGIHDADVWFVKELTDHGFTLIDREVLSDKAEVFHYKREFL